MGKIVMIAALAAAMIRMADSYLYYGRYTDAAIYMAREILRSFGFR
jgi:hypothetical protein